MKAYLEITIPDKFPNTDRLPKGFKDGYYIKPDTSELYLIVKPGIMSFVGYVKPDPQGVYHVKQ